MNKIFSLILVLFFTLGASAYNGKVAFDLDETLIESDKLDRGALKLAEEMGFDIKKSARGQDYIWLEKYPCPSSALCVTDRLPPQTFPSWSEGHQRSRAIQYALDRFPAPPGRF